MWGLQVWVAHSLPQPKASLCCLMVITSCSGRPQQAVYCDPVLAENKEEFKRGWMRGVHLCCHFCLVAFNILPLISVSLIIMYLDVFLLGFTLTGTLCFLDLVDYFLSHVGEVFSYSLFKYFLIVLSLSSPSGIPIMQMLVHLMLSQKSLRLSSFLFILFFF